MKVVALQNGFFDGARQRAGATFEVPPGTKGKWFVPVDAAPKAQAKPKQESTALSQVGKADAKSFQDVHGAKADLA